MHLMLFHAQLRCHVSHTLSCAHSPPTMGPFRRLSESLAANERESVDLLHGCSPWMPAVHSLTFIHPCPTHTQLTSPSSTTFSTENCHAPSADCRTSVCMHLRRTLRLKRANSTLTWGNVIQGRQPAAVTHANPQATKPRRCARLCGGECHPGPLTQRFRLGACASAPAGHRRPRRRGP